MQNQKITHLNIWDISILTLIFFGFAIISSTQAYLLLLSANQVAPENLNFDETNNWYGIAAELLALLVAFCYLIFRRFDFKRLNFQIHAYTPIKIIAYIILAGSFASMVEYGQYTFFPELYPSITEGESLSESSPLYQWNASFGLFALINGFYEEIFFMGLMFAVHKKHLPYVLLFTLLIRFAFHTYQGLAAAITITSLGVVFILLRLKHKDLFPFMLAHSFFDVFGLTWILSLLGSY